MAIEMAVVDGTYFCSQPECDFWIDLVSPSRDHERDVINRHWAEEHPQDPPRLSWWRYDDGGRVDAGFRGLTGDCVTRSIAIVTGKPYREVYDALNEAAKRERPRKGRRRSSARSGVKTATIRRYMAGLGYAWVPTMAIGSGCTVHLHPDELPKIGRLMVSVSKHITAVVDGVIHDTHDPSRDGTRCVYGYWMKAANDAG